MTIKTKTNVTATLRSMKVGEVVSLPADVKEGTVRIIATRMKAKGLTFTVNRKYPNVFVTRTA